MSKTRLPQSRQRVTTWLIGVAVLVVAADQTLKNLVIANFLPEHSYWVWPNVLGIFLTYNKAAAFSIGFGATWFFTITSSLAALVLIWYATKFKSTIWAILAGVLLGGIVGNLADRITRNPGFPNGQVVDYIQIPFNFPIFNLADSCICVVAALAVIAMARGKKIGG